LALRSYFDPETSHAVERLAARGWPADEVHEVEGWLLRRTVGVDRRRCNSMLPPADAAQAARTVELALATAEELDFACVVQVSPAEGHRLLDGVLDDQGMTVGGESLMLVGPLAGGAHGGAPAASATASGMSTLSLVELGALTTAWVDAWAEVSGIEGTEATAELVLSALGDRARFAVMWGDRGEPLAVGIGVAEDGWLGIFSLATAPAVRRAGLASMVMSALEEWGQSRGAQRIYLQVERDNTAALAFYERRGFFIAHSYHYRSA
jgi:ribosomal protein S18 acetylase RimI-like enzyme